MASARSAAALLALAVIIAGCSSLRSPDTPSADPTPTGSLGDASLTATSLAAQAWRKDPRNRKSGLAYARGLMALARPDEAVKVVEELARRNPDDLELAAYLGKIMVQSGRLQDGEKELRRAIAGGADDWRIRSALGSALDQQGRYQEARQCYEQALKLQPNEVSVINNLAMSYILAGDLKTAETRLRRALALPKGDRNARVRQNLALAVGLQGRFDEAKEIASRDLPTDKVEADGAYLKGMLSESDPWEQLRAAH
jgi:Flp pilus assembly protein TadD